MLLESIFPQLPATTAGLVIVVIGSLSALLIIYSIFVEAEHRRDLIRVVAGTGLFIYALYISNLIFMILAGGLAVASLIEFIEIYLGYHKHTPHEIKEYIKRYKKKL